MIKTFNSCSRPVGRNNGDEKHGPDVVSDIFSSMSPSLLPSLPLPLSFINFINREIPLAPSLALPPRVNNFA